MAVATFYPSLDGRVGLNTGVQFDSFSITRLASGAAFSADDTSANIVGAQVNMDLNSPLDKAIYFNRGIFLFNTSSLGTPVAISSAVFSVWVTAKANAHITAISLVSSNPASTSALVNTDYSTLGTTRLASDILIANITTGQYTDFTLNATGIAAINSGGITKLGLKIAIDVDNNYVEDTNGDNSITIYYSEQTGTSNDPKLVITYQESKGAPLMASLAS